MEHLTFCIETHERGPFFHVRQHRRLLHSEAAIQPVTPLLLGLFIDERFIVDPIGTLLQTFHGVFVNVSEAKVRLPAQPDESVATPLNFEQTWRFLVIRFTGDAALVGNGLRSDGSQSELRGHEVVYGLTDQCSVRNVCVYLAVLEQRTF